MRQHRRTAQLKFYFLGRFFQVRHDGFNHFLF